MRSSDSIPVALATAPNWILNVEPEPVDLDFEINLENDDEGFPNCSTLQPMDFHLGDTGYKYNWRTLGRVSVIQSVFVVFMIAIHWKLDEYASCGNQKFNDFIWYYWICVMFMAIASSFNLLVTMDEFRNVCCIATVIAYQCTAFVVWIVFVALGTIIEFSNNNEVSEFEQDLMELSLVISFFAALAACFCVEMLWNVGGFELGWMRREERELDENLEEWNRLQFCTLLSNRYDDIPFEIGDPDQMPEREDDVV